MKYEADKILNIGYVTFRSVGDHEYATNKVNLFLSRCGAVLANGPQQLLDLSDIKKAIFGMLDADLEKLFLSQLYWLPPAEV